MARNMCVGETPQDLRTNSIAFVISVLNGNGCVDTINNTFVSIKEKYGIDGIKAYSYPDFIKTPGRKKIEREMYFELRSEKDLDAWGLVEKNIGNSNTSTIVIAVQGKTSNVQTAIDEIRTKLPVLQTDAYLVKIYGLPTAQ